MSFPNSLTKKIAVFSKLGYLEMRDAAHFPMTLVGD